MTRRDLSALLVALRPILREFAEGLDARFSALEARAAAPGPVGPPGPVGRDGRDGLTGPVGPAGLDGTLEALDVATVDARTIELRRRDGALLPGGRLRFDVVLYTGIWTEARAYDRHDQVTHAGGLWIAAAPSTGLRPDESTTLADGARAWTLCAKRGPTGKPGPTGAPGRPGLDGAPGRDLTQLGPDGRKW